MCFEGCTCHLLFTKSGFSSDKYSWFEYQPAEKDKYSAVNTTNTIMKDINGCAVNDFFNR